MASYKDKINQKRMATESGKIAWAIEFIERGGTFRFRKDWQLALNTHNVVELFDDICMRACQDCFAYEIFKPVEFKPNRYLCKYVQTGMHYEDCVKMLDAQPWLYI